jgi:hypothetical protein
VELNSVLLKAFARPRKTVERGQLHETPTDEGRKLESELARLCREIGGTGWGKMMKIAHEWLKRAKGLELSQGVEALRKLVEEIKVLASQIEAWRRDLARHKQLGTEPVQRPEKRIDEATKKVRQLFKEFVVKLQAGRF